MFLKDFREVVLEKEAAAEEEHNLETVKPHMLQSLGDRPTQRRGPFAFLTLDKE